MGDEQSNATHLGDGLYASYDGYMIRLYTQRDVEHEVFLEPSVLAAFERYVEQLRSKR